MMPALSVVAVSRNDNHGGDLLARMQHFIDGFIGQCRRHRLDAELILVEWNPPPGRPPLEEALRWPDDFGPARVRIVTVSPEVHSTFENSRALPLFQMIGKNVGIRRATGRHVLATNIDILFGDDLIGYLRDRLEPGVMLRVDRYDVPSDLPVGVSIEQVLGYCAERFFQVSTRRGDFDVQEARLLGEGEIAGRVLGLYEAARIFGYRGLLNSLLRLPYSLGVEAPRAIGERILRQGLIAVLRSAIERGTQNFQSIASDVSKMLNPPAWVRFRQTRRCHTNACGDFTLMSRDDWFRLRGYPEWPIYSFHIDSILLYAASVSGIRHVELGPPFRIFHIDHSAGSGWTPQGASKLFARLKASGIPYLSTDELLTWQWQLAKEPSRAIMNGSDWGLADRSLPERSIVPVVNRRAALTRAPASSPGNIRASASGTPRA
jgi:hypothetical protein